MSLSLKRQEDDDDDADEEVRRCRLLHAEVID